MYGSIRIGDLSHNFHLFISINYICFRVGGLWGPGTAAGLYIKEEGITTLFFTGVNTDQASPFLLYASHSTC